MLKWLPAKSEMYLSFAGGCVVRHQPIVGATENERALKVRMRNSKSPEKMMKPM